MDPTALQLAIDKEAPVSRKEFEAEAWAAATAKARELGWLAISNLKSASANAAAGDD